MSWKRGLAWGGWLVSALLAIFFYAVFVHGILRDTRAGEPRLLVDLGATREWSAPLRPWGSDRYELRVRLEGERRPLAPEARVEAVLLDPAGREALRRVEGGAALVAPQARPGEDRVLGALDINGVPWRAWTLRVRVLQPDARLAGERVWVMLLKDRPDLGMGGMMNYVMIFPAGFFALLALVAAALLAAKGSRWPVAATGVAVLAATVALGALR